MVPSLVDDQQYPSVGLEFVDNGAQAGFVLGQGLVINLCPVGGQGAAVVGGLADI